MNFNILYRGPLSSCNYGCDYCPFAKTKNTRAELEHDRICLERFATFLIQQPQHTFSVLFTPWGEGLIRPHYQRALVELSKAPNVRRAVIQTNLSCPLDWAKDANPERVALWTTFHPEWSNFEQFIQKCAQLDALQIRYSVGVVGFPKFRDAIEALRRALPQHVYLWINAVKRELDTLTEEDRQFFTSIDPLYALNTRLYPSKGKLCRAGATTFSVDGDGTMRRCHFIPNVLGNLYDPQGFTTHLRETPCSNDHCRCHIGYVHMDDLELEKVFQQGLLERIPYGLVHDLRNPVMPSHRHGSAR